MTWVFIVAAALVVLGVALVAVGRETLTARLRPRLALFDLEEAVEYVAEHLPFQVSAKLSYDDVRTLLSWHLDELELAGVSGARTPVTVADLVVLDDETLHRRLVERAGATGLDANADDVRAVLAAEQGYLHAIGAIGPESRDDGHT